MDTTIDKPVSQPRTGARRSKRGANGQFVRGASGNPKGRPLGSRNRASLLMEELLDGRAQALAEKAIEKIPGHASPGRPRYLCVSVFLF